MFSAALINRAWVAAQLPGYLRFRAALSDPRAAQESLLRQYLRSNAETEFGRRHGFAGIRSVHDFRERVPLSTYDDYVGDVQRILDGARGVLTMEPVRKLEPSSGSAGAAKLIPYTASLQAEFRRAVAPWLVDLARSTPGVLGGPAYWSITPVLRDETSRRRSATPVGFESDSAYLGGWLRWLADRTLVPCDDLKHATDLASFRRLTLLRLMRARELRLVSVWHPSFLTLLLDEMAATWPDLLAHLCAGVPPQGRLRGAPADAARARELAAADPSRPLTIWPRLAVVSCWGDGHAAMLLDGLRARLPGVRVQSKGLLATEAFVSIPFAERRPIAVLSHFFEFLDEAGAPHAAWELERGGVYSVVVTTGGGLYRYRLRDRVVVQDYLERTPCVGFLGKEEGVCDLCGEKLSEEFVAAALAEVLPVHAPGARFALLAPDTGADATRYVLFIDAPDAPSPDLAATLEELLARNPNYRAAVRLGQLRPVAVERVDVQAAERYLARLRARGQRLGNIKPVALSALPGWREALRGLSPFPSPGNGDCPH